MTLGQGHGIALRLGGRKEAIEQPLQHIPPVPQAPFPLERIEVLDPGAGELQGQATPVLLACGGGHGFSQLRIKRSWASRA